MCGCSAGPGRSRSPSELLGFAATSSFYRFAAPSERRVTAGQSRAPPPGRPPARPARPLFMEFSHSAPSTWSPARPLNRRRARRAGGHARAPQCTGCLPPGPDLPPRPPERDPAGLSSAPTQGRFPAAKALEKVASRTPAFRAKRFSLCWFAQRGALRRGKSWRLTSLRRTSVLLSLPVKVLRRKGGGSLQTFTWRFQWETEETSRS